MLYCPGKEMNMVTIQISGDEGRMDNYVRAIQGAGGQARAGYCPEPDLTCDGLLLAGGGDIAPERYGQGMEGSLPPDPLRDEAELALLRAFYGAGKPILGICRGHQLINVALGGTLIQDLPAEQRIFHGGAEGDLVHPIRTREDTLLCRMYGPHLPVNSFHHQVVDRLGAGLRPIAWSESGFVEAYDLPGRPVLGVQFHPERMSFERRRPDTVDGAPLFYWFVELCRGAR